MSATAYCWLVLAFPLAGAIVTGVGYRALPGRTTGVIATAAVALSFINGVGAFAMLLDEPGEERRHTSSLWDYASAGGLDIELGILVDPLSVFMVLVVSGVSALIHLYSVAYMDSDRGYARFFSYLNFFVFSMLLLVLAGNFALLIVGWAFVGFASYALISFWYRRTTATGAGMKAFVINVVGDVGLVLAAILIFREVGAFDFGEVFEAAPRSFDPNGGTIVAICLLILLGAFAKSAQLPLHTWLPDAMEGPTPVSALIHAATMVTAGVYLIARTHPLFELAPTAADVAAFTGLATLLVAGSIALVVTDLKRIIAYSTMSQIGYMVIGVSIGAYSAGLFHLMTHAFFKALLFMAAGSIIAAMAGRQDIDRMSGFGRVLPFTAAALIVGSLALAGFPGMSGFFSKDEILAFATERGEMYLVFTVLGYAGALITAVYSFRLVFRVLGGEPCPEARELADTGHLAHAEPENPATGEPEDTEIGFPGPEHHIAERAPSMRAAMAALAVLAVIGGAVQIPGVDEAIGKFLEPTFEGSALLEVHPSTGAEWAGLGIGAAIAVLGVLVAYFLYVARSGASAMLAERLRPLHTFLVNKWYFDELIDALVVRPALAIGAYANRTFERLVVDGVVNGTAGAVRGVGGVVRTVQSGFVRSYALLLVGGFAALGLYFLVVAT
jgi:NADH-quinone oxidoreductase subunit L